MDKAEIYRGYIQQLMTERSQTYSSRDGIETQLIFDRERDHYQLVRTGWRNNSDLVYGCVLHVDRKFWV